MGTMKIHVHFSSTNLPVSGRGIVCRVLESKDRFHVINFFNCYFVQVLRAANDQCSCRKNPRAMLNFSLSFRVLFVSGKVTFSYSRIKASLVR